MVEPQWEPLSQAALAQLETSLLQKLDGLGIATTTHEHAPVATVEEAQALRGALPGQHCKCLFLKDKKSRLYLVVARETLRVDLKGLASELNAGRLSFGKPDLLWEVLSVRPGAVTPFALMHDAERRVLPILDAKMLEALLVNYHPLRNDRTTAIAPNDLLKFIRACGVEPSIISFAE